MKKTNSRAERDPMKLLTDNSQAKKELLARCYQEAFNNEQFQRTKTNEEIQLLRKCERALRDAGINYAQFDQLQLKLKLPASTPAN